MGTQSIFQLPYSRSEFLNFLRRNFLPEDFTQEETNIEFAIKTQFTTKATKLGVSKSVDLVVYEIKHSGKQDPRVTLSKEAFRLLAQEWQSRALVLFVPKDKPQNYRFSLIEIKLEGKADSPKIERKYSNPRRYSYYLGEGVGGFTPNKYLIEKGRVTNAKELTERFSVEVLTKAFYGELSDWYAWAIDTVVFPGEQDMATPEKQIEHRSKNVIRLLTRLLFVWFLRHKKLIPQELFDEEYLKENLLKEFNPNLQVGLFGHKSKDSIYYKAILQNLFFATLNCPITPQSVEDKRERGFRKDDWYGQGFGQDHLMRYEKMFTNPDAFVALVNKRVPFLNGGLFDCLDDKQNKIYIDGFSDNLLSPNKLIVPDFLFFGETGKGQDLSEFYGDKRKKNTNVYALIDILKKYNFTIEENTPFDVEVSLDPELLGKVFENLLASYNPETKTTARKQTGSFYTPREIVQYMVDESLVAHLKRTVGEALEPEYRKLMQYTDEELQLTTEQKKAIIQSIQNCKVLDPACGSGAFPVGVLQQMVHILSQLDEKNEIWKDLILEDSMRELATTLKDSTTEERIEIQDDINRSFDDSINRPDYARKLYLIENCIYGVDIQSIAVQISKLRFFISLVVDQKPTTNVADNFGIRPLPNLEAKFMAANTLIGLQKRKGELFENKEVEKLQRRLIETSHRIFGAKSNKRKNTYKEKVEELQVQIADKLYANGDIGNDDARLMRQWRMFDQNTSSPFFDPEYMFGVSGGFDIVIGNPPYIKEYTDKSVFDGLRDSIYYQGKMDLWYMFACCGLDFLIKNGVLCFIAPNNWVTNGGASILRNKVVQDAKILQMNDFSNFMIFESASIQTMVMLFEKNKKDDDYEVDYRRLVGDTKLSDVVALLAKTKATSVEYLSPVFSRKSFINKYITFSSNEALLNRMCEGDNIIYLTDKEIAQGIVFPQDTLNKKNQAVLYGLYNVGTGIFTLSHNEKEQLCLSEKEEELIKPLYNTEQIHRYYSDSSNKQWVIYTDSKFKNPHSMNGYPNIKTHLDKFGLIITSDNKPYGLHRAREERFFKGEKVIALRKCVGSPLFSYSNFDCYLSQTFNIIKTDKINLQYLTGLLNSQTIKFWLKNRGKMQGLNYQLDKEPLVGIPIAAPCLEVQNQVAKLVSFIIWLKANANDSINDYVDNKYIATIIEEIIDAMIIEIYFEETNRNDLYFAKNLHFVEAENTKEEISIFYKSFKETDSVLRNNVKLLSIRLESIINAINS